MRGLLAPYGLEAVSAGELSLPEPRETGKSFGENARIKAQAACFATGLPAFADDSGLAVDALDGAPGIYSARWAGADKNFGRAMASIEDKLRARGAKTPERRKAHFVCALCVAWPDGHVEEFEARVNGTLVWPPRGEKGFGYDPMFLPDGHTRTFGEMDSEEKHGLPPPTRNQAERLPNNRADCAPNEKARSDAIPPTTLVERVPKGLSHRARAFVKLAEACLERS
jgi:XTP/dITP diphosphohydrolase